MKWKWWIYPWAKHHCKTITSLLSLMSCTIFQNQKMTCFAQTCRNSGGTNQSHKSPSGWWFVSTPLKNDGIRQLGWWNSHIWWKKIQSCLKPPAINHHKSQKNKTRTWKSAILPEAKTHFASKNVVNRSELTLLASWKVKGYTARSGAMPSKPGSGNFDDFCHGKSWENLQKNGKI